MMQTLPDDPFANPPGAGKDPFRGRGSAYEPVWLRTDGGIEFIDVFVGERPDRDSNETHELVFVVEQPDRTFNVGVCPSKNFGEGRWLYGDVDLDYAKALAVNYAARESVDQGRNAPWREGPASAGQLGLIRKLGLEQDTLAQTKGEASDILNQHFGSRVLDPAFKED